MSFIAKLFGMDMEKDPKRSDADWDELMNATNATAGQGTPNMAQTGTSGTGLGSTGIPGGFGPGTVHGQGAGEAPISFGGPAVRNVSANKKSGLSPI